MTGKLIACAVVLLCIGISSCAEEQSSSRSVSERLIAEIDPSWILRSFNVSPDSKHAACVAAVGDKGFVVVDGQEGKQYDDIGKGDPIFSPDSQRVAYGARVGDKWLVVVDGEEGKQYDAILKGDPTFSPDSKRVAYGARVGDKWLVVVEGEEGKQYDGIGEGTLI